MLEGDIAVYYISTDASFTSANISSALDSLDDEELRDVLSGVSGDSAREQMITNYVVEFPVPTWEFLSGMCYSREKEKALEEVKKHFKRKLGMLLIHRLH